MTEVTFIFILHKRSAVTLHYAKVLEYKKELNKEFKCWLYILFSAYLFIQHLFDLKKKTMQNNCSISLLKCSNIGDGSSEYESMDVMSSCREKNHCTYIS